MKINFKKLTFTGTIAGLLLFLAFLPRSVWGYHQANLTQEVFPKLANYFLAWDISDDAAEELAKWDLLILSTQAVDRNPNLLQLIKQYNPQIKILAYFLSQEIPVAGSQTDPYGAWGKIYSQVSSNNWWLRDTSNNSTCFWPNTKLINITTAWRQWLPEYINNHHLKILPEWDGVFYDNCWPAVDWLNLSLDLNNDGQPDSAAIENNLWSQAMAELLNYSKQIFPSNKLIVCNGGTGYKNYYHGRMFETFPIASEGGWLSNINDYLATGNYSIINSNTLNVNNQADYRQMRFGLTSALLGNGYYSFDFGDTEHGQLWWYDEYSAYLGKPLGPKTILNNNPYLQQRDFERGLIVVNAADQKVALELNGRYEKIIGSQAPEINNGSLVNALDIPAQDGLALLKPIEQLLNDSFNNGSFAMVFNNNGQKTRNGFFAYQENLAGGLEIILKDIDQDGQLEIVTADKTNIKIYNQEFKLEQEFAPYGQNFKNGFFFLVADLNNNGNFEIITSPKSGGSAHVKTFSTTGRWLNPGFMAYPDSFTGGASLALIDTDHDGLKEILTAPGPGANYPLRHFSQSGQPLDCTFPLYDADYRGGVNIASGDVNGDGQTEIVAARRSGSADIKIFNCYGRLLTHWLASKNATQGIQVKVNDIDADGQYEIITLTNEFL
ncbi:hypothetical protein KJ840_01755 [Patescibacteria group bacterium]|nr:hypothetical protein [Patescibacteria group bacterium]